MIANQLSQETQFSAGTAQIFCKIMALLGALLVSMIVAHAQAASDQHPGDPEAKVIDGVVNSTVFGLGQSIRITGSVKEGAIAFGGDVIVEGSVDGDVAAIGGSVIQREGSRIGGDVIVLGGIYKSATYMYAGYEDELRRVMRDPFSLLRPQLTAAFFGTRLLAVLVWFIISLALTAVMPNTVSRAVARLQLSSLRVAIIALIGTIVIGLGVPLLLLVLPSIIGAPILIMALLLVLVSSLFGRVVIFAATGNWLRRRFFSRIQLDSVALLLGVVFWVTLESLPYVWPFVIAGLLVVSLGLALTARYRITWKKPRPNES